MENERGTSMTINYNLNKMFLTLSSYMFHLKRVLSEIPDLKWSVLRRLPPYSNVSKKCLLCLYEKLEIVTYENQKKHFNKRFEVFCKCRHVNKFF